MERVFNKSCKCHMTILLDFSTKIGKEDNFKPGIGNENLYKISNDSRVRDINFAILKITQSKIQCCHIVI
jgi:hypothetical protein